MPIRFFVLILMLATSVFAIACGNDSAEKAVTGTVVETGKDLDQDARGLAAAAREGEAAKLAKDADASAREATKTMETPGGIEAAADEVVENIERSQNSMDETYEQDRAAGESVAEAAGDAYEAVLEIPEEKKQAEER
jgi:membrane-bound ClpP family serine protease